MDARPQQGSPDENDRYLSQLSGQITWLRELIVVMVGQERDTRRQSELLFEMLRALKAAKLASARHRSMPAQDVAGLAVVSRPEATS